MILLALLLEDSLQKGLESLVVTAAPFLDAFDDLVLEENCVEYLHFRVHGLDGLYIGVQIPIGGQESFE